MAKTFHGTLVTRLYVSHLRKQILTFYDNSNFVLFFRKKRILDFINFFFVFFYFCYILFLAFSLWFPAFPPLFPYFHPDSPIPTLIPRIPTLILRIPTHIPRIPILVPHILTLVYRIPTLIPRVHIMPINPFPNSPFWLLQIAKKIDSGIIETGSIKMVHTSTFHSNNTVVLDHCN